ncbi:MAG: CapA family protein [Candidatus Coatesbacteria bacterium]|nr:MAG: CapA family protein [Candidatus Coatesbacteria bacterium]
MNNGFGGYRSSVLSFVVICSSIAAVLFAQIVFPGLMSSWRSARLNAKGIDECSEGNLGKGKAAFLKAGSLNPDNAAAHYNLALVLLSSDGDAAGAAEHLAEVIRLKPDCAVAHHNLGVIELFYRRNTTVALENLRRAAALDSERAATHLALGYLYEYSGEYGKAREEFSRCASADPGGPLSIDAEAAVEALVSAPLVDDLAEKLSYEETVYEIDVAGGVYPSGPPASNNGVPSPLRYSAPVFGKALMAAACLVAPIGHSDAVNMISDTGIDVLGVLPNATDDFAGTIGDLEREGIAFTGLGSDLKSATKPARIEIEEVGINVLAFTGASPVRNAEEKPPLTSAPLSVATVSPAVSAAAEADIVVVMFRWAEPPSDAPTDAMVNLTHAAADAGADIIVGVGTEVTLPVETYGESIIAYGLSDLLPPADRKPYAYTRLLAVQYSPKNGVLGYRLVPVYVENEPPDLSGSSEGNLIDFRLVEKVPVAK